MRFTWIHSEDSWLRLMNQSFTTHLFIKEPKHIPYTGTCTILKFYVSVKKEL